jgi:hypothetical protein
MSRGLKKLSGKSGRRSYGYIEEPAQGQICFSMEHWEILQDYVNELERAVGRTCENCVGCHVFGTKDGNECEDFSWNGRTGS